MQNNIIFAIEKLISIEKFLIWRINISPLQFQILSYLNNHPIEMNRVINLSKEFNLKKSTISRSLNLLLKKGYVNKIINSKNRKQVYFVINNKGREILKRNIGFEQILEILDEEEKILLYNLLLKVLKKAYDLGFISSLRSCYNCKFFNNYYCEFLKIHLTKKEIKIDCLDYKPNL